MRSITSQAETYITFLHSKGGKMPKRKPHVPIHPPGGSVGGCTKNPDPLFDLGAAAGAASHTFILVQLVAANTQDLMCALEQDHTCLLLLADNTVPAAAGLLGWLWWWAVGRRCWPLNRLLLWPPRCASVSRARRVG